MTTMTDNIESAPATDNIRTLLHYLGQALDMRLSHYRKGTIYEKVRPSDVRLFVAASRKAQTISALARTLGITRQAAQSAVHRLEALQVLALEPAPANKRDKIVIVTSKGEHARKTAVAQIKRFESEFADVIGEDRLHLFRADLKAILDSTRARNQTDSESNGAN
jgi:DNA-binding MarR family transcriptional regulator